MKLEYLATQVFPVSMPTLGFNEPNEIEGIACIGDNRVIVFYSANGGKNGAPMETDPARIQVFQAEGDPRKTKLLSETSIAGLGHVNSAGYNPDADELYVNRCMYSPVGKPDTVTYSGDIFVLNTKSGIKKARTISCKLNGKGVFVNLISYDKVRKKLYGVAKPGSSSELFEINTKTGAMTSVLKFADIANGHFTSSQGLAVRDGVMYWQTVTPRCISVYSIAEKKLLRTINLPVDDCYGHAVKYPQDLDYDENGVFYMTSQTRSPSIGYGKSEGQWRYNYLHRFDPDRDVCGNVIDPDDTSRIAKKENFTVYVDRNTVKPHQNGTKEYPFATATEAFYSLLYRDYPANIIEFLSSGHYDEWLLLNGIRCTVSGVDFSVNAMALRNCSIAFLNKVSIPGAPADYNGCYSVKRVLYVTNSDVAFTKKLEVTMKGISNDVCYVENSEVTIAKGCRFVSNADSVGMRCVNSVIHGLQADSGTGVVSNVVLDNTRVR